MARNPVDLKRMRYIVEVARAEAITTAAETLGLTQPALTRSISEVEEQLGTRLFHRLHRGMRLTEPGERFVTRARQILGDVEDLVSDIREGPNLLTGRLRLGVAPTGYLSHASAALTTLAGHYPGIKIEIEAGTAQTLCPKLLHGELNVMVGSSSYLQRWRGLDVTNLKKLHYGCMVRKGHPITKLKSPEEADILSYPVILPASVEPTYTDIAQRYVQHGLQPMQPQYVSDDYRLIVALMNATDAFHPLHHPDPSFGDLGRHYPIFENLVKIPDHHISIAFSSLQPKSEAVELFAQLLTEEITGSRGVKHRERNAPA